MFGVALMLAITFSASARRPSLRSARAATTLSIPDPLKRAIEPREPKTGEDFRQ